MRFIQEALQIHKLTDNRRQILIFFLRVNKYKTEAKNEHAKLQPPSPEESSTGQNWEINGLKELLAQPEEQMLFS